MRIAGWVKLKTITLAVITVSWLCIHPAYASVAPPRTLPGGSNGDIQYNNHNNFGGISTAALAAMIGGGGGGMVVGDPVTGGGIHQILYIDASGNLAASSSFQLDNANTQISFGAASWLNESGGFVNLANEIPGGGVNIFADNTGGSVSLSGNSINSSATGSQSHSALGSYNITGGSILLTGPTTIIDGVSASSVVVNGSDKTISQWFTHEGGSFGNGDNSVIWNQIYSGFGGGSLYIVSSTSPPTFSTGFGDTGTPAPPASSFMWTVGTTAMTFNLYDESDRRRIPMQISADRVILGSSNNGGGIDYPGRLVFWSPNGSSVSLLSSSTVADSEYRLPAQLPTATNQVLTANTTGDMYWVTPSSGRSAGPANSVQVSNSTGGFAGNADFSFDDSNAIITMKDSVNSETLTSDFNGGTYILTHQLTSVTDQKFGYNAAFAGAVSWFNNDNGAGAVSYDWKVNGVREFQINRASITALETLLTVAPIIAQSTMTMGGPILSTNTFNFTSTGTINIVSISSAPLIVATSETIKNLYVTGPAAIYSSATVPGTTDATFLVRNPTGAGTFRFGGVSYAKFEWSATGGPADSGDGQLYQRNDGFFHIGGLNDANNSEVNMLTIMRPGNVVQYFNPGGHVLYPDGTITENGSVNIRGYYNTAGIGTLTDDGFGNVTGGTSSPLFTYEVMPGDLITCDNTSLSATVTAVSDDTDITLSNTIDDGGGDCVDSGYSIQKPYLNIGDGGSNRWAWIATDGSAYFNGPRTTMKTPLVLQNLTGNRVLYTDSGSSVTTSASFLFDGTVATITKVNADSVSIASVTTTRLEVGQNVTSYTANISVLQSGTTLYQLPNQIASSNNFKFYTNGSMLVLDSSDTTTNQTLLPSKGFGPELFLSNHASRPNEIAGIGLFANALSTGTNGGDTFVQFGQTGDTSGFFYGWTFGRDNSDYGAMKLSASANLGQNDLWRIDPTSMTVTPMIAASTVSITNGWIENIATAVNVSTTSNNLALAGTPVYLATVPVASSITGFVAQTAGYRFTLVNVGTNTLTITHESGSSTAANRIWTTTGSNTTISGGQQSSASAEFIYDGTKSRWRQIR